MSHLDYPPDHIARSFKSLFNTLTEITTNLASLRNGRRAETRDLRRIEANVKRQLYQNKRDLEI